MGSLERRGPSPFDRSVAVRGGGCRVRARSWWRRCIGGCLFVWMLMMLEPKEGDGVGESASLNSCRCEW